MSKPSNDELKIALQKAAEIKEHDADPYFVSKVLLNHHYRLSYLGEVLQAADRFINHGMSDSDRINLIRAINRAKDAEERSAGTHHDKFGLE